MPVSSITRSAAPDVRAAQPRQEIYDLYWIFAAKRQDAFCRRAAGEPAPWSDDPILQVYKFCNTYRAADRVSQYLIRDVIYGGPPVDPVDKLFQIILFRLFSKIETWQALTAALGNPPILDHLASGALEKALSDLKASKAVIYTSAFILCANDAYGQGIKFRNHLALMRNMFFESRIAPRVFDIGSLQSLVALLQGFPLIGPFMSYQIAVDINYSELVDFSEDDFTQAGPGCLRGIEKAFSDTGSQSPAAIVMQMVERQEDEFKRLDLGFKGLWGRPLHAIDCQGLFCELDKYCREAAPHLVSARSRIKARFAPQAQPIHYFFPPKWGLNPAQ